MKLYAFISRRIPRYHYEQIGKAIAINFRYAREISRVSTLPAILLNSSMIETESINHLITALNGSSVISSTVGESQVLNNIVYYLPRIRDYQLLAQLIHASFHWKPQKLTIWQVFEASSAVMKWKLEISEPRLSIHKFVSLWKQELESCSALNIFQLATLAGLISCRQQLEVLQEQLFIDDSGTASEELKDIKFRHFMPYWNQYMNISKGDHRLIDDLCILYSMVHMQSDYVASNELLFQSLFNILMTYINNGDTEYHGPNAFAYKHLNLICQTCEHSISNTHNRRLLRSKLEELCRIMGALSDKETLTGRKKYTDKYYINILFIVVILLSGYKPSAEVVHEITMTLFYTSFILQDFGLDGFTKYQELIYSVCGRICQDFDIFDQILKEMISKMQFNMDNKIYHSKLMFILEYLQLNLAELKIPDACYLEERIEPLVRPYLDSSDVKLRESAHLVWLEVFNNETWKADVTNFKLKRLRLYLHDCFRQCSASLMTEKQLIVIWKSILPTIRYLSNYDNDLIRDLIHSTYIRIINTENLQMKSTSIQCLIEQFHNVPDEYLWDWLDACNELARTLPPLMKEHIITKLWEYISHSHNELAIRWWYDRIVPNLSRI